MNILFIGYTVPGNDTKQYTGLSVAGNKMQQGLLEGLSHVEGVNIKALSVTPVASFPKDRRLFVGRKKYRLRGNVISYGIPFINISVIKQISQILSLYLIGCKMAAECDRIVAFNMYPEVGVPALMLKKKYDVTLCSILADLPFDPFDANRSSLKKLARKIYNGLTRFSINRIDSAVSLNKNAVKMFANDKPYIIVEGGIRASDIKKRGKYSPKRKNLLYSGALTEYSGIRNLIEAFRLLDVNDIELDIYGSGPLEDEVGAVAEAYVDIHYHGSIPNEELIKKQSEVFLLINPRPIDDAISQVTFPSKIIEYMASGTPVLSTKLSGLNEGFCENLFVTEDDSPKGLADAIYGVISKSNDELSSKAERAYDFIKDNMTWDSHAQRIAEFLKWV